MRGSCRWQFETARPRMFPLPEGASLRKYTSAVPSVMNTTSAFCRNSRVRVAASFIFAMHSSRVAPESEPCASQLCQSLSLRVSWKTSPSPKIFPSAMALICRSMDAGLYTVPNGFASTWNFRTLNCADMLSAKHEPKNAMRDS